MIVDAPLSDKTNQPTHPDSVSAFKPGTTPIPCNSATTPIVPTTTPGAPTPTPGAPTLTPGEPIASDEKEKPQCKPKLNKAKQDGPAPSSTEMNRYIELQRASLTRRQQMSKEIKENVNSAIHNATTSLRNVINDNLNRHLGTEHQKRCEEQRMIVTDALDSNKIQFMTVLDNKFDAMTKHTEETMVRLQCSQTPHHADLIKAQAKTIDDLTRSIQMRREKDQKMKGLVQNTALQWPHSLFIFEEARKYPKLGERLQKLHCDVECEPGFLHWLSDQIYCALKLSKDIKHRWLLNHLAFFDDLNPRRLMSLEQCNHCKQFLEPRHIQSHSRKCFQDPFRQWIRSSYTIPKVKVSVKKNNKKTVQDFYKCFICGYKHKNRRNLIAHLYQHDQQHLKRFNLDVIMSHAPTKMATRGEYRCIADPAISFNSSAFGSHQCIEPNCCNLLPRLHYRLKQFDERDNDQFKGDAYDNEDYIEDNEELLQLLKEQAEKVVQQTMILKDRRHGKQNKTEEDIFWCKK